MTVRKETITITESLRGKRLDSYLPKVFPAVSRGTFQRLIEEGHVLVNGKHAKPTQQPHLGDVIEVTWPPPKTSQLLPQNLPLEILYEDEALLVINKPAGLVVHPAAGHEDSTLVNALLYHCAGQLSGVGGVARPGIVHRLDKETSGCLVIAKNDTAHVKLSDQFKNRTLEKLYLALACGVFSNPKGEIRAAIQRHPSHRKRMAVTANGGREAWTSYRVIEQFGSLASLVQATLHTGRTHQIRVHLQHLGHPIAGDNVYGARQTKRLEEGARTEFARQMLHAYSLKFTHPITGSDLCVRAPLPVDFTAACQALRAITAEKKTT